MQLLDIKIITGLSGSGKSSALHAFEDSGYYCVDNMPVSLLPKFLEMPVEPAAGLKGLAFVMDLREYDFLKRYPVVFEELAGKGYTLELLFFEAEENILIQRYNQTRRQHPLAGNKGLLHGIRTEQQQLQNLRRSADRIIDTSAFTIHELKNFIFQEIQTNTAANRLRIQIISFGFKFGIPHDADMMVDVRFLPNPYFVSELKNLDGKSKRINNYVLNNETGTLFTEKLFALIDFLIPLYKKEPRAYFTIGIGCTGGRHRSIAVAVALYEHLQHTENHLEITHRDIWQE